MKSRLLLLVVTVLSIVFVTRVYLRVGFPYTHDGENHLARFANYALALREGQFPPRIAPVLFHRFGYPVFNYNYPLANILSVPFAVINLNYETIFKILVIVGFCFGSLGISKWLESIDKKKFSVGAKIFALVAWITSPFIVSTVYFRGSIGEILAYCLIPWLFYSSSETAQSSKVEWSKRVFFGAIWAAFLLSHNSTVFYVVPLMILYIGLVIRTNWQRFIQVLQPMLIGVGLSVWFWLPAIAEISETIVATSHNQNDYVLHFPTFRQLLTSPLAFGFSYPGDIDSLSFKIGFLSFTTLLVSVLLLFLERRQLKKNSAHIHLWYCCILAMVLVFFQLDISSWIWESVPMANFVQFPWRLSLFLFSILVPVFAFAFARAQWGIKLILLALLFFSLLEVKNTHPVDWFHHSNEYYETYVDSTSTLNENRTKNFVYTDIGAWEPTAKLNSGEGSIQVFRWTGIEHLYTVTAHTSVEVIEPTMRFAGWQTIANTQRVEYIDSLDIKDRIAYRLNPGVYQIATRFTQWTPARVIGNMVSFLTVAYLLGRTLVSWYYEHTH
jgi:hypothetical protein